MESFLKRTWAEINLDNVVHNFNIVRNAVDKKSKICCVIKADGYGHGAVCLAKVYEKAGADWLGVSNLEEAMQLRNNGTKLPILIFGYTPVCMARSLCENNISQAVFSLEYAKALSDEAVKQNVEINIHLKIDTGMNRLGIQYQKANEKAVEAAYEICKMSGFITQGIFTHFSVSDEINDSESVVYTKEQMRLFADITKKLEQKGISFEIRHSSNSGGILNYHESDLDMVRAGIILYGLKPAAEIPSKLDLRPVMTLKSVVSQVKTVEEGDTVSYGRTYAAQGKEKHATIPVGYADGYMRALAGKSHVSINGYNCPVVGRVCMDQIIVNVTNAGDIKMGDEVIVFGCGENNGPTADDIARWAETINYEVTCLIGKRVARVYIKDGEVVMTSTLI